MSKSLLLLVLYTKAGGARLWRSGVGSGAGASGLSEPYYSAQINRFVALPGARLQINRFVALPGARLQINRFVALPAF